MRQDFERDLFRERTAAGRAQKKMNEVGEGGFPILVKSMPVHTGNYSIDLESGALTRMEAEELSELQGLRKVEAVYSQRYQRVLKEIRHDEEFSKRCDPTRIPFRRFNLISLGKRPSV